MDAPCRIRRARAADLKEVGRIERAAFSDPWAAAAFEWAQRDARSVFLVAEDTAGVCGYGIARSLFEEAEIQNLAVAPDRRRRGVGRALVAALLVAVGERGAGRIFLEVRVSNEPAQQLYRSLGFLARGRRRGYYNRPLEDALILVKELGTSGVSLVDKRT